MREFKGTSEHSWAECVRDLQGFLCSVEFTREGAGVPAEEGFLAWSNLTQRVKEKGRTVYLIGNGASASMASHFAADLAKNGQLHTQVFSDLSLITAISNDMGYEHVFSEPLRRRAKEGDMLVAISSSGCSPNVLEAVKVAKDVGVLVVGLSAMDRSNPLRSWGDLSVYVPAETYGYAETCHAAILHYWMDGVQSRLGVNQ